jgi:type VI secretion system secreted protein Hcp
MAVDYFLKIDGIDGESTDSKHANEIEISSFSFGASNPTSFNSRGGGASSGKVSMQDFHFTMNVNKASPKLMLSCATGQHIKSATLTCRKAGEKQVDFLIYTFTDLLVSSYQTGGTNGGIVPTDQFSLSFSKIEVDYRPQNADGTLGTVVHAGWDLTANQST